MFERLILGVIDFGCLAGGAAHIWMYDAHFQVFSGGM
jgi:hypothetical protein